jgi:hypothetical protein
MIPVLFTIAALFIIIVAFIFKSIPKKNKYRTITSVLIAILFLGVYIAICIFLPDVSYA